MLCCSSKNVISDQINKEEKDSLTTEAVDSARVRVQKKLPRQAVRL
jgi:hypothetical protein